MQALGMHKGAHQVGHAISLEQERGLTHTSMAMPCTPESFKRSKAEANHFEFAYLNCPSELTCTHHQQLKSAWNLAPA